MKHLVDALMRLKPEAVPNKTGAQAEHIIVSGNMLMFQIQDGPIKEAGTNGVQATDILEYAKHLFQSLNEAFPCRENAITITKIEEAILWQHARTLDREKRGVEGRSKG